ncbi:Myb/SANT-like domain [Dillenia turbinata]|uniref:Myb/SANT-like domain n=1 Tax=Dillenia turbinata TaxID=194707 RepID=A0AAN8ZIA0_9MAGN
MDMEVSEHQPKQERLRTRWTASLDKIFADLVVEQIRLGNRPNNIFDKKTWNHIRDQFNKMTNLNFNNNQLRKHLDVLRTRYCNLKSALDQNEFTLDESCCIGFDLWENLEVHSKLDATKIKDCPIYEQLCTIFAETGVDGRYARSSHYEELDKSAATDTAAPIFYLDGGTPHCETPPSSKLPQGGAPSVANLTRSASGKKKKKRPLDTDSCFGKSTGDPKVFQVMANALLDMVAASKIRALSAANNDDRFSISNCINTLDQIQGIDDHLYFAAINLFEDPSMRETFMSLRGNELKLAWLYGRCANGTSA